VLVLRDQSSIKITDFNISKFNQQGKNKSIKMMTNTGTEAFKAPEMLTDIEYK